MTTNRQYLAVKFKPSDTRTYTYHNDGEPVSVGDRVVVTTNRGPSNVTVESVSDAKPTFETKPIDGLVGMPDEPKAAGAPVDFTSLPETF